MVTATFAFLHVTHFLDMTNNHVKFHCNLIYDSKANDMALR